MPAPQIMRYLLQGGTASSGTFKNLHQSPAEKIVKRIGKANRKSGPRIGPSVKLETVFIGEQYRRKYEKKQCELGICLFRKIFFSFQRGLAAFFQSFLEHFLCSWSK